MSIRDIVAQSDIPPSDWAGWNWAGTGMPGLGRAKPRSPVAVDEATALTLTAVYGCVERISNPLAYFPVEVIRSASGRRVFVDDHPVARLLNGRANPFMTARTLRKTGTAGALLWGNAYIEVQRDGRNNPVALWPLLPWHTRTRRAGDSLLVHTTTIDGQQFDVFDDDCLHVMGLSLDGYQGLSPIQQAASAVGLTLAAETFGAKFYENESQSGGFIMHPGKLGAKAVRNIQDSMSEQGGLSNASRVKVLEEGAKYIATTIPPDAAQFLGTRAFQLAEIARMYNVPLHMLQSETGATSWGSGLEQLDRGFVAHTLSTWVAPWESEINEKLFSDQERTQGYRVRFNFDSLLRGDSAARAAYYTAALSAETGWLTRNEVRELEDYDPLDRFERTATTPEATQ